MSTQRVSAIMSPNVVEVTQTDSLEKLIVLLEEYRISGLPVSDGQGRYVGVISKTDIASQKLLTHIKIHQTLVNATIKDFMSQNPPLTVAEDAPIDDAIELMDRHKVHRVFVVDGDGKMIGIVSTSDIIRQMRYTFEAYL